VTAVPTLRQRALLAREGIFNLRDLGGLPVEGGVVAPRRVLRGDALHRAGDSVAVLRDLGVVRVLDLRDEVERKEEGVLEAEALEVQHHPVLDPRFPWADDEVEDPSELVAHRYREILTSFGSRFATALGALAEVACTDGSPRGAVAYHCAVGKDRTGLLTALLLGALGADHEVIVADYARTAAVTPIQVSWLWSLGHPAGQVDDDELRYGLWSARPETMRATLEWLQREHGGFERYLADCGLDGDVVEALRAALVRRGDEGGAEDAARG